MDAAADDALAAIAAATSTAELKAARAAHTGEASALARLNAQLRNVPNDQKAALGKLGELPEEIRCDFPWRQRDQHLP